MKLNQVVVPRTDLSLSGLTYTPDRELKPACVILSHGYTASKESMDLLAGYVASRGYPCLTFDCRGHKLGATGGRLDDLADAVNDVRAAASWAKRHFEVDRCVLVGHSMGGILSVAAAAEMDDVAGVCAIAIGPEPTAGFRSTAGIAMLAQRADYVEGMEPLTLLEGLGSLVPLIHNLSEISALFVAARGDILVKSEKLRELSLQAGPLAEFAEIDGSHLEAPDRARGTVANWLDRVVR
jgi:pimeloyl-ACP methyl ester carboxylesterase